MRKLAFDLGTKTCGFAISDSSAIIASALTTITFEEQKFENVIEQVNKFINEYKDIDSFILGYPLRSNGNKSERTIMVEDFAKLLHQHFDQNVYFVNEYGTTIQAENTLKSTKMSAKKRKQVKDTVSAVIILQEFLNYGGIKA
ncbi:Holliday junction resolvase RuvX [Mycoplasma simbae]|uniref:Holliday junction resolvase RuvX n=1 Tax=Mycoplasma simbae TaxID=36744 RepID=UPI0004969726|nr:Holliday junction resolvase RuvX [Mycoplasma simbae]